jgi:8-oxo-dGTP pyrophosphatase MutT (NUDIX family)
MNAKNPYDLLEDSLKVAKALIFDKNDRILVLERGDGDNLWDIPGGHLKKIEENRGWAGTKEGLEREVAEETGLFLPNEKFIGTFNLFWKEEVHEITVFATKLSTSEPEVDLNLQNYQENLSYEWVSYEELLKMLPNSVKTLKYAVEFLPKDKLISMEEGNQLSWAKKHRKMKTKLIGMGKNKHTGGGKGHKRPNMSRSKSAPAGFGVLEEDDDEKPAKIKVKIAKKTRKAAIIKGNPAHLAKNKQISDKFYKEIADILKNEGFDVDFHESKAFSWPGKPKKMVYDLWIGHSLGSDRLEGAVEGGYTRKVIGFGVPNPEKQPFLAINHPKDDPKPGKIGGIEHYLLSNEMKKALKNTINRPKKPNFTYMGHHPAEDWDSKWHDSSKNKRGDK